MINPSELNSYSQRTLAEKHQRADMDQLARIATGQTEQVDGHRQGINRIRQFLHGLLARLRVARLGA